MKVYSYVYSHEYRPSAPVVDIGVSGVASSSHEVNMAALVDSGADATMLPIGVLRAVGARYMETKYIQGTAGIRVPADMYLVTVRVGPHIVPSIRAVAVIRNADALLGRDVLNYLIVTFNGPAGVTEIAA